MKKANPALAWVREFLSGEEDPAEPHYDPVHLGGTVVVTLAAVGCLYWLLWTFLVYEGGIFLKVLALARLAGGASLQDLGWKGYPYAMGELEGIVGNFAALGICVLLAAALRRLYLRASRKRGRA